MALYNLHQQAFIMSFLSNGVSGVLGTSWTLEETLRALVTRSLEDPEYTSFVGNDWELVWGPVVYQNLLSDFADDAMMVVRRIADDGAATFIVAIAGTNPASAFAWLQDFAVTLTVPFHGEANISQGTMMGVAILESLIDPATLTTLEQFLASVVSPTASLIFTGHSLGGALAPALALDLVLNRALSVDAWKTVVLYPTAGPTPGDAAFADLFATTFPHRSTGGDAWDVWNANVRNTLDYVPYSWSNLAIIPDLYLPHIDSQPARALVADMIAGLELSGANVYAPLRSAAFAGRYRELPPSFCPFLMEEIHQHIAAYANVITPELAPRLIPLIRVDDTRMLHRLAAVALEAEQRPRKAARGR